MVDHTCTFFKSFIINIIKENVMETILKLVLCDELYVVMLRLILTIVSLIKVNVYYELRILGQIIVFFVMGEMFCD